MRNLNEMNNTELLFILGRSKTLQEMVSECNQQNILDYWLEVLDSFDAGSIQYEIGTFQTFVTTCFDDLEEFIEGMNKAQEWYYILSDEELAIFKTLEKRYHEYDEDADEDGSEFQIISRLMREVVGFIEKSIQLSLDSTDTKEGTLEYFLSCYLDTMLNDDCDYIYTVDDEYNLYRMPKNPTLLD